MTVTRTASPARGLAPVREVLPTGVTVLCKETRVTPAVTLHASIRAGAAYDPPQTEGIAHFVSRTIDRGTRTRSADQIAEELESRGAALTISVNRHTLSLVCTCLVEDFEVVLALLADVIRYPTFPDVEVETRRGEIITQIRQDEDNPATVAIEGFMAALYGEAHPYGRRVRGTVESVQRIDRAGLETFHRKYVTPQALSLAIVGDINAARALASSATVFGDWPETPSADHTLPLAVPSSNGRRTQVIPMMNKAQADIAYGFITITRSDPAYYAYWLMNNILGQYSLGGRLGDSIRERQGMAYFVMSALDASIIPGPLMIRAGVSPANVERAIASIDEELAKLVADGPTEDEVVESKRYLIGSMPRALETNASIATFLQTLDFFGLGLDYDVRVPALLEAVTRDEIHAAARRAVDPSSATVVVAGPYTGSLR